MTTTYKVLGQALATGTGTTDLYTVGTGKSAICSSLVICNQNNANATFNVAVRPGGATLASSQYLAYGTTVTSNDFLTMSIGLTLAAGDVITVYGSTSTISFNLFGTELS